ncbi:MAG TPA: O-antigen ligase family protein [Ignavibacteria bacterium]
MKQTDKYFKNFIYAIIFSPIIGYFSYNYIKLSGFGMFGQQLLCYLAIPIFIIWLFQKREYIIFPKYLYFFLLYIIYIYIWDLFNGNYDQKGFIKYIFNNYNVYIFLFLIIFYNVKISNDTFKRIIYLLKFVLVAALGGSIIQTFIPDFFVNMSQWSKGNLFTDSIYTSRRPSIFTWVSDNDYGITVPAYLSLLIAYLKLKVDNKQILFFVLIIILYAVLSNTRYVMLGTLLVISQLFIFSNLKGTSKNLVILFISSIIFYQMITIVFEYDFISLFSERLFAEKQVTNSSRYYSYELFLRFFGDKPIFGTGIWLTTEQEYAANAGGSSQIHIGYLAHLISYGLVGSFLLFSFWFALARDLFKKARKSRYFGGFFGFLVYLAGQLTYVDYILIIPGILLSIILSEYYYQNYLNNSSFNHA